MSQTTTPLDPAAAAPAGPAATLTGYLQALHDSLASQPWSQIALGLLLLAVAVLLTAWLTSRVLTAVARRMLGVVGREQWAQALTRRRVFRYVSMAMPLLLVMGNLDSLPLLMLGAQADLVVRLSLAGGLFCLFLAFNGLLSASQDVYSASTRAQTRSIKGYIELGKILVWGICVIVVIAVLVDRSPLLMLSGLGALSAVLLLVFKDTLLSLVASTQMASNDMLRIGDWIEMPQAGADGFVIDFALHTVKVQNWDKTVTTIPTYKLFSESFRNWRHMFESGGRRIKRTLRIDAGTIRFLTEEEIESLRRFALLRDYLDEKQHELEASNKALGEGAAQAVNRRRLTNIGTFRAYATAYLRRNPEIHQDMLLLVRMMEPDAYGVPVELYCFSNKTAWVEYERIQGNIFDHLLAILPELWLRLYQAPAGGDIGQALRAAAPAALGAALPGPPRGAGPAG